MHPSREERVPRLLEVDLGARDVPGPLPSTPEAWSSSDPRLERAGAPSGTALGLARFLDPDRPAPALILCVGSCVRRGLPTAARASVLGPTPLTGRLAEGQVGSELGRRLAGVTDALVLRGRTSLPGAVLHLSAAGGVELLSFPELAGADPVLTARRLEALIGESAVLRCGVAGERRIPFANLAAGGGAPSFVGRGGLGAVLGATGLKAIAISAPPVSGVEDDALTQALLSSPRLAARGAGGTLELAHAFAVRGDLYERGYERPVDPEQGARLAQDALSSGRARHGCKGCPTPCGWVFERSDGRRQGAHFSAVYALGTNLGLEGWDDALFLLESCNRLGIDAKEAGACLALYGHAVEQGTLAGEPVFGDRARLAQLLEELAQRSGSGALLSDGAAAFAARHALDARAFHAGGEAARPVSDLAAVLGQCVSPRGAEPMRTFPFLVGDGVARARTVRLLAPFELPPRSEDPRDPAGKGRLVWWHENLVAALDATGFCAFSAAGLLSDGIVDLDALGRLVLPAAAVGGERRDGAPGTGARLLALGANVVLMHHLWNERAGLAVEDQPDWAAPQLAQEGMLGEYRAWRGLDGRGRPTAGARAQLGSLELLLPEGALGAPTSRPGDPEPEPGGTQPSGVPVRAPGSVTLRGWGPLRAALGPRPQLTLELPATVGEVLEYAARERPGAALWLWREGVAVPAAYRAGERLEAGDLVRSGDCLELVVAVSGGST